MSDSRELHIAPGTAAGGCVKQALNLPAGNLLDNQDLFSCGPLLPLRTLDEWIRIREGYLRALYTDFQFSFAEFHRDLLTNTKTVLEAKSVTVWVGTGLAEQLFLAWMPQFLRLLEIDVVKLRVIQFSSDPSNGDEIQSVGILNPDKLKAHPAAEPLDEEGLVSLDAAWAAVTAADPSQLVEFLAADPGPLPFLQRSIRWLMYRFPDVDTGLSHLQMELLRLVAEKGPTAVKVIGYTMARTIDWLDWVGDVQLFSWLKNLGAPSLPQPLVSLTGNREDVRETEVYLTDTGKSVLAGEVNSVKLNGIDDWVGGIHLDSAADRVWFQRNGLIVADHRLLGRDRDHRG
jgi:Domain of unknown function (DUF1835)